MTFDEHLAQSDSTYLEQLKEILAIPSISGISEHRDDVQRAASWLRDYMEAIGLERATVRPTAKNPVVTAEWLQRRGAPTALIYGHYDVQPVDPLALWTTPPFQATERDGRLYARGSSDDKGQVIAHLQAIASLIAVEGGLPVNIKVLIEGEEEIGSPSLEQFIKDNKDWTQADVVVISDTSMMEHGLPTICCGLRGLCEMEVHLETANTDLHSGLYGGAAPNALHVLVQLLASVRDGQGRITIPGFYDGVVEPTSEERKQMAALPFDEEEFAQRLGVDQLVGEPEFTALERISIRPTLELNGLWGGFQGEGPKTVIPNEAHAKITCRLVPEQEPERVAAVVAEYLTQAVPAGARVRVDLGHVARPWRCDPASAPVQAAVQALEQSFGRSAALARMGGSIPVVEVFDRLLGAPCVLMGFAAPDSNAHAPNESLPLESLRIARRALGRFWHELGERGV